jgi:predicted metallopeptidase
MSYKIYYFTQNFKLIAMNDTTRERHEIIYREYERVLRSHGKYARLITRIEMCREVGDTLGYSPEYVIGVIRKIIKTKTNEKE